VGKGGFLLGFEILIKEWRLMTKSRKIVRRIVNKLDEIVEIAVVD